ncbi:hypothetical protein D6C77_00755 [Aureobasidium pullulans]|uniref:Copper acquisition factor BIM1-like domain-containing protein n=1 Tax=Aureobasidium pullulans TaxID=5580 RepID=A0A4S9UWT6_AURPU|nr:hypothetical protein D6D27_03648 [Aureobasidium pullulans]THY22012.1 hypothetical protein D6D02_01250 [Aureobasidium pullulans]THY59182.1 hypothetical protein D6C99_01996 [Aureobasidium pullulans]THY65547.1 hypothetical protein D6C98_00172 [Aureobasidium pullulans]THY72960.1 hypothetical protein D6C94_06290 [Aureobasidium pullulans]
MLSIFSIVTVLAVNLSLVHAHTVITYPGWRGNNLHTNGTLPQHDASALGINYVNGSYTFPYGMQWQYPCGGMPMSTNRSLWPVNGGAIALQPGWFKGHRYAQFYVNVGIQLPGEVAPQNMSFNVVPAFQITGPSNDEYPQSAFCLPQVPLPAGMTFNVGDNITLQIVELAQHGAAIYNCADVTLVDAVDVPEVNRANCYNSSDLSFQLMYATANLTSASSPPMEPSLSPLYVLLPLAITIFAFGIW